ncbi:uncharacterized protein MAM_07219 [Metarhizium album ARSEF 1941]|uniref:Uncharacterized protein n=1 Tax=Metarhizium album (strain ARSEF 1941) TaxID=1081103 RepID=A0A0B2WNC6_METAS|nr:uncharacterized protein MAM_07219 [Metarhizium album ARSEF 1941]KHN94992.1 hypothetical protein MAM_07219 [Metarhizium album ARSEF 1941]
MNELTRPSEWAYKHTSRPMGKWNVASSPPSARRAAYPADSSTPSKMYPRTFLMAATASAAAIYGLGETPDIGVTFYEHANFEGISFAVPSLGKCWSMPTQLKKTNVSSVKFFTDEVTCLVYSYNRLCLNPPMMNDLKASIRNLHDNEDGDQIRSVFCKRIPSQADENLPRGPDQS